MVATLSATASAAATPQIKICDAIAATDHLRVTATCPKPVDALSFTVKAGAPAGYKATVAYTIIDNSTDAQTAWQDDASGGPETTLPTAGRVPNVPDPSYLYFASGQSDAEAAALVGTVIVDVIIVPQTGGSASLKSPVEALLRSAAAVVRTDESHALG